MNHFNRFCTYPCFGHYLRFQFLAKSFLSSVFDNNTDVLYVYHVIILHFHSTSRQLVPIQMDFEVKNLTKSDEFILELAALIEVV